MFASKAADLGECRDGAMSAEYAAHADRFRVWLAGEFHAHRPLPVMFPTTVRSLLLLVVTDARIDAFVNQAVLNEKARLDRGEPDAVGYIYAFHVRGEHPRSIKIGLTVQKPAERVKEWSRELRKTVDLLFAYRTNYTRLVEQLVHRTLFCEWLSKRINHRTGRKLVEFFEIRNVLATKLLIASIIVYAEDVGTKMRQQQQAQ